MSQRLVRAGLVPALLVLTALASPAIAEKPRSEAKMTRTVFCVADLVVPNTQPQKDKPNLTQQEREQQLIELITASIEPKSWNTMGGPGTIDYFPHTMALVINQTPAIVEQVTELLTSLRRLQEQEVAVEVRFLSVTPELAERVFKDCISKENTPISLNDKQVFRVMETVQGDMRSNVMQAPKMTVFNGQASALNVKDEVQFVTGLSMEVQDGRVICTPKVEKISCGVELFLQPVISADRRYVRMKFSAHLKNVDTSAPLLPVTVPVTPEDGVIPAKPQTFTQYIQQPKVHSVRLSKNFVSPDGQTMVFNAGTQMQDVCGECPQPMLSDIPVLGSLFKVVRQHKEPMQLLVMVTPRIIIATEEEEKQAGQAEKAVKNEAAVREMVEKALQQFSAAYKEGRYRDAEKWARLAVHLDPDNAICNAAQHLAQANLTSCQPAQRTKAVPPCACPMTTGVYGAPVPLQEVEQCGDVEPAPCCKSNKECGEMLKTLLNKYQIACAVGQLDEAREYAIKALTLDPTCFSKKPTYCIPRSLDLP
jgi:hypothetical protein